MTTHEQHKPVIVLDVGKVLVDYEPELVLKELSRRCGREIALPSSHDMDKLFLPVYVGSQSWGDIIEILSSALGFRLEPQEWHELWCGIFTGEVPGMKEALTELKGQYRLVALSNTEEVHWSFIVQRYPILELLDGWVLSHTEGVAKPDRAIYAAVVDRYCDGRLPVFYTDDSPQYVEAARRLGWEAEVFTDAAHFKEEIGRYCTDSPKSPQ